MISVNDAIQLIRQHTSLLPPQTMALRHTTGLVLAADVIAPISLPVCNQSAMDGYAFRFDDLQQSNTFTLAGEVGAGDSPNIQTKQGEAVRIFTGAAVPPELDTIVMQEKAVINGNKLQVLDEQIKKGSNVRLKGDEIRAGELALKKGTPLSPAAIGFLAGLGFTKVTVYPKPAVCIIVTGKELQKPGTPLASGQIYESNSVMLQAALNQLHINNHQVIFAGDDLTEITEAISKGVQEADLVILTGGVSVGDYDFVVKAAEACGATQLFHKVKQRPGKPLYLATKNNKLIFGLPGNPASVLCCFYNYVVVALEQLTGKTNLLEKKSLPLLVDINKKISLTQFLKAICTPEGVQPLTAQESFRLSSFSIANCLLVLPEEAREYRTGEDVEVLVLPYL